MSSSRNGPGDEEGWKLAIVLVGGSKVDFGGWGGGDWGDDDGGVKCDLGELIG